VSTAAAENKSFTTTIALGGSLTRGNSETLQSNLSIISEGEREGLGLLRMGAEGNYGRSKLAGVDETTVKNAKLFGNAKKTLSDKFFASLDATYLCDDIARIDYRAMASPGVDVYLVKSEATKLSIESGGSYVWEKVASVSDEYFALRAAQRFSHVFSKSSKIWQSLEYLPEAKDFGNYLIAAEIGAEAALNDKMNLRCVLQSRYDSEPGAGLKKNDLQLVAGISVKI